MRNVKTVFSSECGAVYKHILPRNWAGSSYFKFAKMFNPYIADKLFFTPEQRIFQ
jgi:hypothetical protein